MADGHGKRSSSMADLDSAQASKRMYTDFQRMHISKLRRSLKPNSNTVLCDTEMRGPSSYDQDKYTVIVDNLDSSSDELEDEGTGSTTSSNGKISLLGEIEKRMTAMGMLLPQRSINDIPPGSRPSEIDNMALVPYKSHDQVVRNSLAKSSDHHQFLQSREIGDYDCAMETD